MLTRVWVSVHSCVHIKKMSMWTQWTCTRQQWSTAVTRTHAHTHIKTRLHETKSLLFFYIFRSFAFISNEYSACLLTIYFIFSNNFFCCIVFPFSSIARPKHTQLIRCGETEEMKKKKKKKLRLHVVGYLHCCCCFTYSIWTYFPWLDFLYVFFSLSSVSNRSYLHSMYT